jgi:hypothetical protein
MGVVDEDYLQATSDRAAVVGRKIQISPEDVKRLCAAMRQLGEKLARLLMLQPNASTPLNTHVTSKENHAADH